MPIINCKNQRKKQGDEKNMAKKNYRANKKTTQNYSLEELQVQTILNCLDAKKSVYRHYQQWLRQHQSKSQTPKKPLQQSRILFFVQCAQRIKSLF